MSLRYCQNCGIEIKRIPVSVTGNVLEVEPHFCRSCGQALVSPVFVDSEWDSDDLEVDSEFDIYDFKNVQEIANIAIPENAKELTLEQLRKHAVQAIWKRLTGIDPFPDPETEAAVAREHERQMQVFIERGTPPSMALPASHHQAGQRLADSLQKHHLAWVNGLVSHVSWTAEEVETYRPIVAKFYYTIEPCDCDAVEYVPSETAAGFLRRA